MPGETGTWKLTDTLFGLCKGILLLRISLKLGIIYSITLDLLLAVKDGLIFSSEGGENYHVNWNFGCKKYTLAVKGHTFTFFCIS